MLSTLSCSWRPARNWRPAFKSFRPATVGKRGGFNVPLTALLLYSLSFSPSSLDKPFATQEFLSTSIGVAELEAKHRNQEYDGNSSRPQRASREQTRLGGLTPQGPASERPPDPRAREASGPGLLPQRALEVTAELLATGSLKETPPRPAASFSKAVRSTSTKQERPRRPRGSSSQATGRNPTQGKETPSSPSAGGGAGAPHSLGRRQTPARDAGKAPGRGRCRGPGLPRCPGGAAPPHPAGFSRSYFSRKGIIGVPSL